MKKFLPVVFSLLILTSVTVFAQRSPAPAIDRDPLLEQDAKHNLDVAWQAFGPARKAYKQVIGRFEETYAAYPDFSKMDEFLYLAGMSSYYLSDNKGKQKLDPKSAKDKDKYSPEKLKENAAAYLATLVDKYPESKYRPEAESTLKLIKDGK
ncbi:MAG: outer membrane protein assembly factor BamD [Acidobacteriota bacterium]